MFEHREPDRDRRFEFSFSRLVVDPERLEGLHESHHVSRAAYVRLLLPELVPSFVTRLLYLDCDVIVLRDIGELFTVRLDGSLLAAVESNGSPVRCGHHGCADLHRSDDRSGSDGAGPVTGDAAASRYVLPPPFDHVPVRVGPAAVEAAVDMTSLHAISEFISLDDDTVVFRNDMVTLVVHGTRAVSLDVRPGVHDDVVDAVLYGYAMRLLFLHAGVFSLHGSLVRVTTGDGARTVAVAGHSGAGKSTTVSYLAAHHGASILIDDVLPITVADGVAVAHPFDRPVHLLPDAAARLGMDAAGVVDGLSSGIGKLVADIASASGTVAIDQLVFVTMGEPDAIEPLTVTTVTGAERLRYVVRASNSTGLMSFGRRADAYVAWVMQVASAVEITHIVRSPGIDTLDAVARHIIG